MTARLPITVRDNARGVPPGTEQQVFLPLFSATEGGSGLTVVRQWVHDGGAAACGTCARWAAARPS